MRTFPQLQDILNIAKMLQISSYNRLTEKECQGSKKIEISTKLNP